MATRNNLAKILIGGFCLASLHLPAMAAEAPVSSDSLTLDAAASYVMPATGAVVAPSGRATIRRRISALPPVGGQQLQALKQSALMRAQAAPTQVAMRVRPHAPSPGAPLSPGLAQSCSNVGSSIGYAPSDSHGAVGQSNFVTVKNVTVGVYRKSDCAAVVAEQNLATFFASKGVPATATLFDPRVLYDASTDRFFLTAESMDDYNTDQYQYFAVSKDGSATSWWLYRITLSKGRYTTFCKQRYNSFWDYPSAGLSRGVTPTLKSGQGRWFITANDFGNSGGVYGAILSIDKAPSLSGQQVGTKCFGRQRNINIAPPIVLDNSTVSQFLSPGSGGGNTIARLNLTASTLGASRDTLTAIAGVAITSWSAPPQAAQPNGEVLDTIDGRFQSASIQSLGYIWNVHTIGLNGFAAVRLYRLGTSSGSTTPSVVFTPTTADGEHLFNPSFATASGLANDPAFITASRTIPADSTNGRATSVIFSGVNASSTAGDWTFYTLGQSPSQYTGCDPVYGCRWGDYSATQIDPLNKNVGWGFNQRVTSPSEFDWSVEAGSVSR